MATTDAFLRDIVDLVYDNNIRQLTPITDYRRDIGEGRILYSCKHLAAGLEADAPGTIKADCVLKIKMQVGPRENSPDETRPIPGPSETTKAELEALTTFRDSNIANVPHLVSTMQRTQGELGPFPGGYVSYTVMSKMPGDNLMDLAFWSMPDEKRETIRAAFLSVLK